MDGPNLEKDAIFRLFVSGFDESTEIAVVGIEGYTEFLRFLDSMCSSLPAFTAEFIQERVDPGVYKALALDFLVKFVGAYIESSGIEMPSIREIMAKLDAFEKIPSTVH